MQGHESKHNLSYWQGRDYIGIGPGEHEAGIVQLRYEGGALGANSHRFRN